MIEFYRYLLGSVFNVLFGNVRNQ